MTITDTKMQRMLKRVPPGLVLCTESIDAYSLSVTDAANILHVSRPNLSSLLNGRGNLSSEMTFRFEKAFGVDMEKLMRIQNSSDIAHTHASGPSTSRSGAMSHSQPVANRLIQPLVGRNTKQPAPPMTASGVRVAPHLPCT